MAQPVPERFPEVTIRPMVMGDIEACATIVGETPLWRDRYGISQIRAAALLQGAIDRKEGLLIADEQGVPIGFAWYLMKGAFGRSGYLRLLAVRTDRRNSHAGAALLEAVEGAVGQDLFILVSDFNTDARRFYSRHGYKEIGQIPGYILPDVTEIILWRRK